MTKQRIVSRTFMHSSYVSQLRNGDDALVISELLELEDGSIRPNLRAIRNPEVTYWMTQEQYRDHKDKKEFEKIGFLNEHTVQYQHKERDMFRRLNGFDPNFLTPKQRRELMKSPYIYAGNINVEAFYAIKYKNDLLRQNKIDLTPTTGFFDTEKSLLRSTEGQFPIMTFTAENKVYVVMKRPFMYQDFGDGNRAVTIDDIKEGIATHIDPLVTEIFDTNKDLAEARGKLPFTYELEVFDDEGDMIRWIFGKMHESKVTFIGVWNLGFDIPEIIRLLGERGIPLEEVFCDPELRRQGIAYANYREDKRDVAHFTQKWHWMTNTAVFQFIDSMSLFSYTRVVDGKEPSYALDDILKKYNLGGKLKIDSTKELEGLQTGDWHRAMLSRFFVEYVLYAIWDVMGLQIMEWLNNDISAMVMGASVTPVKFFPNQTIRVTNTLFHEWRSKGVILGTGVDIEAQRDDDLLTAGGAVLEPQHMTGHGLRLIEECPNHHTQAYAWQNDFDFSAQYPTNIYVLNISKQTKVSTLFAINADWVNSKYDPDTAVEVFCSYLVTPNANGVELGTEFFNLPKFDEVDQLFREFRHKKAA